MEEIDASWHRNRPHMERDVLNSLVPMFPQLSLEIIRNSILKPENRAEPFDEMMLLQRCIDDLLSLTTRMEEGKNEASTEPSLTSTDRAAGSSFTNPIVIDSRQNALGGSTSVGSPGQGDVLPGAYVEGMVGRLQGDVQVRNLESYSAIDEEVVYLETGSDLNSVPAVPTAQKDRRAHFGGTGAVEAAVSSGTVEHHFTDVTAGMATNKSSVDGMAALHLPVTLDGAHLVQGDAGRSVWMAPDPRLPVAALVGDLLVTSPDHGAGGLDSDVPLDLSTKVSCLPVRACDNPWPNSHWDGPGAAISTGTKDGNISGLSLNGRGAYCNHLATPEKAEASGLGLMGLANATQSTLSVFSTPQQNNRKRKTSPATLTVNLEGDEVQQGQAEPSADQGSVEDRTQPGIVQMRLEEPTRKRLCPAANRQAEQPAVNNPPVKPTQKALAPLLQCSAQKSFSLAAPANKMAAGPLSGTMAKLPAQQAIAATSLAPPPLIRVEAESVTGPLPRPGTVVGQAGMIPAPQEIAERAVPALAPPDHGAPALAPPKFGALALEQPQFGAPALAPAAQQDKGFKVGPAEQPGNGFRLPLPPDGRPNPNRDADIHTVPGGGVDGDALDLGRGGMAGAGHLLEVCTKQVVDLFPDADVDFVKTLLSRSSSHFEPVNVVCNYLLEHPSYPKKKVDEASQSPSILEAEEEMPVDYYKDYSSSMSQEYKCQALTLLQNEFRRVSVRDIRKLAMAYNGHYAPTRNCIVAGLKANNIHLDALTEELCGSSSGVVCPSLKISGPRNVPPFTIRYLPSQGADESDYTMKLLKSGRPKVRQQSVLVPELRREVQFVLNQIKSKNEATDLSLAMSTNESDYQTEGQTIECGCCYDDFAFENMVQCFEGHLFCRNCLQNYAKEAVYGQGKAKLLCMTDDCEAVFPRGQLEIALPKQMMAKYEDRLKEEDLNMADIEDLVRCPYCDFAAILDPGDKVFKCQSCLKETCRHCKEEWKHHFGIPCSELEKQDETKLRVAYEEKMTNAKMRKCRQCSAMFYKSDGCNRMTCRCGATMCYICRQPNIAYTHFCGHVREPGRPCETCTACSLWTNPEEDDKRAVAEIKKEASDARKAHGFVEEKAIGAPEVLPASKKP